MKTDTIAAIATALSDSGIGIIRISGDEAVEIADQVFRTKSGKRILETVESHTIHYGFIVDFENENKSKYSFNDNFSEDDVNSKNDDWKNHIIDEVMVSVMRAPRSFTAEDTVEINCHGGVLMMQKILEVVLQAGARMAGAGEFTKRAFLNGRIDLSKAEAVIDVIHSQNEYALSSSVSQLRGVLSNEVKNLREELIYEIAFIESALDDPEHISLDGYPENLSEKVVIISDKIKKLIDSANNGKLMKEGIATVIVGKPNAGKSSVESVGWRRKSNRYGYCGDDQGYPEQYIKLHGIGLNVIDTAGIRDTEDTVEKIGVERAKKYAKDADLIVYVVDASVELDESDREICSLIDDKNVIILLNKTDLENVVTEEKISEMMNEILPNRGKVEIIRTSTKESIGIDVFENVVKDMFFGGELHNNGEVVITNMRHKEALRDAYQSLKLVKQSIKDDMPEDFYSIDLMSAYASLGTIIGEEVGQDLVNEIFSKFCMGK